MSRRLVRPALVPAAVAAALPCALVQWSVLGAGMSLLLSAALVFLGMQITHEERQAVEFKARADALFDRWHHNDDSHGGAQ
jgi:hypothetical protein